MKPHEIKDVQETFEFLQPYAEPLAELFYTKLFQFDPKLQKLFHTNMREQGQKLMLMLELAVDGLDDLPSIIEELELLGKRHAKYGVQEQDFETVKKALLWAIRVVLDDKATKRIQKSWTVAYDLLSSIMREQIMFETAKIQNEVH